MFVTVKMALLNLVKISTFSRIYLRNVRLASTKSPEVPDNPLKEIHSATQQPENGVIYDKKPFRITCEEGKTYAWCLCGKSKGQPLCDGTHKNVHLKIKLKPVKFTVPKTGEYWLCNCKQTMNRPFCDGTHKQAHIQEAIK